MLVGGYLLNTTHLSSEDAYWQDMSRAYYAGKYDGISEAADQVPGRVSIEGLSGGNGRTLEDFQDLIARDGSFNGLRLEPRNEDE